MLQLKGNPPVNDLKAFVKELGHRLNSHAFSTKQDSLQTKKCTFVRNCFQDLLKTHPIKAGKPQFSRTSLFSHHIKLKQIRLFFK
jgi:hypothetical protein